MDLTQIRKVHFIGIGGIGISAIARMMLLEGKVVSGSDQVVSLVTNELAKLGAKIFIGHKAEQVPRDADLLIYTIAIPADNPERQAGEKLGLPAMTYPEALGEISKTKTTVAVAGTHGKTTTTAMIAQIALAANLNPTVVVGSFILDQQSNFIAGRGDPASTDASQGGLLITEACEYKRSFLNLTPKILIITNIDNDHLDYYKDLADIQSAFAELAAKVPTDGFLICAKSEPDLASVITAARCQIIDYRLENTAGLKLLVSGAHNILNAQAALAVARALKVDQNTAVRALNKFKGTWRRFEFKGELANGVLIYDDYAHHPTEIKATLAAAKEKFPTRRIVVVFQPHLYSRTKLLLNEFAESFKAANQVLVAPIYAAREAPDPSISSEILTVAINKFTPATAANFSDLAIKLKNEAKPADLIITLGAGNICDITQSIL